MLTSIISLLTKENWKSNWRRKQKRRNGLARNCVRDLLCFSCSVSSRFFWARQPLALSFQRCKGFFVSNGQMNIFSFFSGAGFLDLGFELEGHYNIVFVNEFHKAITRIRRILVLWREEWWRGAPNEEWRMKNSCNPCNPWFRTFSSGLSSSNSCNSLWKTRHESLLWGVACPRRHGPALDAMFLCLHGSGMAGHIDRDAELRRCCRWWRSRTATGFIGHQIRM